MKDEFGNFLGNTYPKRAKGLIKKGRAEKVSEYEIRLVDSSAPPDTEDNMKLFNITDNNNETITVSAETGEVIETAASDIPKTPETGEVIENTASDIPETPEKQTENADEKKAKTLFFNAREWKPSKEYDKTVATRSFITDPFGKLTEAYMIGDWDWHWSQIETAELVLEKNTDYEFVFWLNGGENDRNQETCRLEIVFDADNENRSIYNLNRNFIRYERHYKGWYLYRIPFNTGDACYTKLRFVAMAACATVMHADEPESYVDLPEDPAPTGLPQRHNIFFGEGFPRNARWSKDAFPDMKEEQQNKADQNTFNEEQQNKADQNTFNFDFFGGADADSIRRTVMERIQEELEDEFDVDDIADEVAEEVMDNIDVDAIRDKIIQSIRDSFKM